MTRTVLDIYRALPPSERADYRPTPGMRGAPQVRALQELAAYLAQKIWWTPKVVEARRLRAAQDTRDTRLHTIPLGSQDARMVGDLLEANNRRLRNWTRPEPTADRRRNRLYRKNNEGRYSYRCTFTHYTYTPMLLSAGRISDDGSVLGAVIDESSYTLLAPRGYRWGVDANGIRLYKSARPDDDLHPTSDDIRAGVPHIVSQLRENAETRRAAQCEKLQQDRAAKLACAHGIWVSLEDSRAAGNCEAGTLAYCERHHLDRTRHYRAEVLRRAEDSRRVELAIAAAKKRQLTDWQRGYSDLPGANRLQVAV